MDFQDTIKKLRMRMADAVALGLGKDNPAEFVANALEQVMNESERHRQDCLRQMVSYRELSKAAEYQASAYSQVYGIIWAVYNAFVVAGERDVQERQAAEAVKAAETAAREATEQAERKALIEELDAMRHDPEVIADLKASLEAAGPAGTVTAKRTKSKK